MNLTSINVSKILIEFKPLIYKTMQRLNIHPKNMNYDDYFQELQIKLVKIYKSFEGDPLHVDTDRYKFVAYASQGLYWHGLNLFRQKSLDSLQTIEESQIDWLDQTEGIDIAPPSPQSNLYIEDFLTQAKGRLSDQDYLLFLYIAEDNHTIQELADLLQVSRDTIYQRKKRIQMRLQDIKECLMD